MVKEIDGVPQDPQSANDYEDRASQAVKKVLLDLGQLLGSYRDSVAIIGGSVPWLLLTEGDEPHVGTLDIDIALDHEALAHDEYALLIETLMSNGYQQSDDLRVFQLGRKVKVDDRDEIRVVVDFLMAREAQPVKNSPPLVPNFAVIKASGADLALNFNQKIELSGEMLQGGKNTVQLTVCSIPAFLAMKGFAINNRRKAKDAYDIYYSIRHFPGHIEALAAACLPILEQANGLTGFRHIAEKFATEDNFGPTMVRAFVEESAILAGRTPAQWQTDAFGQVDALMQALKLR
ncbi:nucleotidyl transferase AbiEii/AbiGii toxin family protein [Herbaspirillum sp.]|uniref:nucleotidyl transferase AbiEii/AbiGii toxin family protein n=1 Tax=Herbaspirillum TaxID=963 RepID=UPI0025868720|nr:nucleotidyl transferase AbiEii/AbiGii toxin family protein [Herbaspirillum sp.]MCP3655425.1 nucleotidyl transferase AbiEii/AbiGii toxin family protein [Herbaspirillum sp.]MCP3947522.1 nucleotidyl transferase AbiEii/AbiGii toxin family protein [Herbaspirillum sp.]MCP3947525.1 nucleotidyl transferase AbiEii/AbiGii toxin family protein [Herbaspirillum sp.]MCP4033106.1 nucleotidyl transferase AbiEii/AbiGii toxin family protein [Herbaspirillum sp.]MCP4556817.1 nucleotidyl transferase AbiEii/AbiG